MSLMSFLHIHALVGITMMVMVAVLPSKAQNNVAMYFQENRVEFPIGPTGGPSFTVEFWMFVRETSRNNIKIFHCSDSFERVQFYLGYHSSNGLLEYFVDNYPVDTDRETRRGFIRSPFPAPLRQWVHVAVVQDGKMGRIYLDTILDVEGEVPVPVRQQRTDHILGTNTNFRRSLSASRQWFFGMVDQFRVWDTVRTPEELLLNLQGLQPGQDNLVIALNFESAEEDGMEDDWTRITVPDVSGNDPPTDAKAYCKQETSCLLKIPSAAGICGDAKHNPASEECDDGNLDEGDGCSSTCEVEDGFVCHLGRPTGTHTCLPGSSPFTQHFESNADLSAWSVVRGRQRRRGAVGSHVGSVSIDVNARYSGERGVRLYQGPMFANDDASLPETPKIWLTADKGIELNGNGRVKTWRDQSGNGNDAEQLSDQNSPEYHEDAFDSGMPAVHFAHNGAGMKIDGFSVPSPFSVFALTRYTSSSGGNLLGGQGSSFLFGVTHKGVGWHNSGTSWVRYNSANSNYYYAAVHRWYLLSGIADTDKCTMHRDAAQVAEESNAAGAPGKLALHRGINSEDPAHADIAELIVYDRALTSEERETVEQYVANKYDMHGPSAEVCRRLVAADKELYVTSMSRHIDGVVTASTYLHAAVNIQQQPYAFGLPLWLVIFEHSDGVPTPSPALCTSSQSTCGGLKFYSICVNGGDQDVIFCDETMDVSPKEWHQLMIDITLKFSVKYGSGSTPAAVRAMFATMSCDRPSEAWIDEVRLISIADNSFSDCDDVSVESAGGGDYQELMIDARPSVYYRLGDSSTATIAEQTNGVFYIGSDGDSASTALDGTASGGTLGVTGLASGTADTALELGLGQDYIQFPTVNKTDGDWGFSVEMWVQLKTDVTNGRVTLASDYQSSSEKWFFKLGLDSSRRILFSITTEYGETHIRSDSAALEVGETHHLAASWEPKYGNLQIWLDAEYVATTSLPSTKSPPNIGLPENHISTFRLGYDGSETGSCTAIIDEFALYRRAVETAYLFRHFYGVHSTFDRNGVARIKAGSSVIEMDAGDDGAVVSILRVSDLSEVQTKSFNFNSADLGTAQAAINEMRNFVSSGNARSSANFVAIALRARNRERKLLYDDRIQRADHRTLVNRLRAGYYYMNGDYANRGYPRTWSGAKLYCEDRNMVLCAHEDYCDMSKWPTSGALNSWKNRVEGLGWAPYDDLHGSTNRWLSVGLAYRDRVCRNYTEIFGSPPSWGNSDAPSSTPFLCCFRAAGTPGWVADKQRWHHYVSNFTTDVNHVWHDDPRWRMHVSWFRSDSYYTTVVGSRNYWHCRKHCQQNVFGSYVTFMQPEALVWKDYSFNFDMYVRYRMIGFIFRYTDKYNFYMFTHDSQTRCASIVKYKDANRQRVWNSCGIPIYAWNWYDFRVDVAGNTVKVYRNWHKVMEWEDVSGDPLTNGTFGFWTAYNRYTYINNIRVYDRPPVDVGSLNSKLRDIGLPPLPFEDEYYAHSLVTGSGYTYAGLGRYPENVGWPGWATVIEKEYSRKKYQAGLAPVRKGYFGDGKVVVRTLFNCHSGLTYSVPENSRAGSYLPFPLRGSRTAHPLGYFIHTGDNEKIFHAEPSTGHLYVAKSVIPRRPHSDTQKSLDFERSGSKQFQLTVVTGERGFDSGWFTMRSFGLGELSYREVSLGSMFSGVEPALIDVRVQVMATDGPNAGMIFGSMGAAAFADDYSWWPQYGGVISAVGRGGVRLWAPTFHQYGRGAIINLGSGSGAVYDKSKDFIREEKVQKSHTAMVRVLAEKRRAPAYDSGWVMARAQEEDENYMTFEHGFGEPPEECRVMVRAVDGPNVGYVFEARGDAQTTDYYGEYGGAVYAWSNHKVKVYLPDRYRGSFKGYAVYVGPGWGNNVNIQSSTEAELRVMCWRPTLVPSYENLWGDINFFMYENASETVPLPTLQHPPAKVQVLIKETSSGWVYPAVHMEQSHNHAYHHGGGVVFAYNSTHVRLWAPSPDPTRGVKSSTANMPLRILFGWGGERGREQGRHVQVKIRAWEFYPGVRDSADITLNVRDVAEPPSVSNHEIDIDEIVDGNLPSGRIYKVSASDPDAGSTLTYSIVGGDENGAFTIDENTGEIFIRNATLINYEQKNVYYLGVQVSDGIFSDVGMLTVNILNKNDPVHVFPKTIHVEENTAANYLAGFPVESFDEDWAQTVSYRIVGGNDNGAFRINDCSGQIRVNRSILNYEEQSLYYLTVEVEDTGVPPTTAQTTVVMNITDINDPPVLLDFDFEVDENSFGNQTIAELPAFDEDGDPLDFEIANGDLSGYFAIAIEGKHGSDKGIFEGHDRYVLQTSGKVITQGDGSGTDVEDNEDLVLDFEDPNRPDRKFVLQIRTWDDTDVDLSLRSDTNLYQVFVVDVNDRPLLEPHTLTIEENSGPGSNVGGKVNATDQDRLDLGDGPGSRTDPLKYSIDPAFLTGLPFEITTQGQVKVAPDGSLDFEKQSRYVFDVIVEDSGGNMRGAPKTNKATVAVVVQDLNEAPTVNETFEFSVDENTPPPYLIGWLNAVDQDIDLSQVEGDPLSYSIIQGNENETFRVNQSGHVFVNRDALDFETHPVHNLLLQVTDPEGLSSNVTFIVNLNDKNDPPEFQSCPDPLLSFSEFDVNEGYSSVIGLVNSPGDVDDVVTFRLGAGLTITDWEMCRQLCAGEPRCAAFTVFLDDYPDAAWHGQCYGRSDSADVMLNTGKPGVVAGRKFVTCQAEPVRIDENTAVSTQVGDPFTIVDVEGHSFSVNIDSGSNPNDAFEIVHDSGSTYHLQVKNDAVNFEDVNQFLLRIVAQDTGPEQATSVVFYSIYVNNLEEKPQINNQSVLVVELDPAGTFLAQLVATDEDASSQGELQFSLQSGTPNSGEHRYQVYFDVSETGEMTLKSEMKAKDITFRLVVRVTDEAGLFNEATIFAPVESNNNRPVFDPQSIAASRSFAEHSPVGTPISPSIEFEDANVADSHTWEILDVSPSIGRTLFTIESDGTSNNYGVLKVAGDMNYECNRLSPWDGCPELYRTYTITVRINDTGLPQLSNRADVDVSVLNLQEEPQTPTNMTLVIPELAGPDTPQALDKELIPPQGYALPDFYDDDKAPLQFTLESSGNPGYFRVESGTRTRDVDIPGLNPINNPPSNHWPPSQTPRFFLDRIDGNFDHETTPRYTLEMVVSDGDPATQDKSVVVDVLVSDVHERPIPEKLLYTFSVDENSPGGQRVGTVKGSDPDTSDTLYFYLEEVKMIRYDQQYFDYEVRNPSTGRLDKTFKVDTSSGQISLRQPSGGASSVIDYEQYVQYNVTVEIRDRPKSDGEGLSAYTTVIITVNDLEDVSITRVTSLNGLLQTTGNEPIEIDGENFGPFIGDSSLQVDVRYACSAPSDNSRVQISDCRYQAQSCSITKPNTKISCKTAPGVGSRHKWRVSITDPKRGVTHFTVSSPAQASLENPQTTSYEPPTLDTVTAPLLSTRGGETVTLSGKNFGIEQQYVSVGYGNGLYTAACTVQSHESILCQSAEGVGVLHWWIVTVDGQSSALEPSSVAEKENSTVVTSYLSPRIGSIRAVEVELDMLDTKGTETLVIEGENFGSTAVFESIQSVREQQGGNGDGDEDVKIIAEMSNGEHCGRAECTVGVDHVSVLCPVPVGVGRGFEWVVIVAAQQSNRSPNVTDYHSPVLQVVGGGEGSSTEGGTGVQIQGDYFGPGPLSEAETPPYCKAFAHWGQREYNITVTYGVPRGVVGPHQPSDRSKWFRAHDCRITAGHVAMQCTMGEGTGRNHRWVVEIDGQETMELPSGTFYAPPFVTTLSGEGAPAARTEGGERLIVAGANFGTDIEVVTNVTYGPTGVEFGMTDCVIVENHRVLECTTPEGVGAGLTFTVIVDSQRSSAPKTRYQEPIIRELQGVIPGGFSTRGGQAVTVVGENFGTADPRYLEWVAYGPNNVYQMRECTILEDHTRLRCVTMPGVGANHRWTVRVEGQSSLPSFQAFSYARPRILAMRILKVVPATENEDEDKLVITGVDHIPTIGGRLRIVGLDFGTLAEGLRLFTGQDQLTKILSHKIFDAVACSGSEISEDLPGRMNYTAVPDEAYCIETVLPASDGRGRPVKVSVGGQSSATLAYSYANPEVIQKVVQQDVNNEQHKVLYLRGKDFGLSGRVYVSSQPFNDSEALRDAFWRQHPQGIPAPGTVGGDPSARRPDPVLQASPETPRYTDVCYFDKTQLSDAVYRYDSSRNRHELRCLLKTINGLPLQSGYFTLEVGVDRILTPVFEFQQLSPRIIWVDRQSLPTRGGEIQLVAMYLGSQKDVSKGIFKVTIGKTVDDVFECSGADLTYAELADPPSGTGRPDVSPSDSANDITTRFQCPDSGEECPRVTYKMAFVKCTMPRGEGEDLELRVWRSKDMSGPIPFSFEPPALRQPGISAADGKKPENGWWTPGGQLAYVFGVNFGLFPRVTVGGRLMLPSTTRVMDIGSSPLPNKNDFPSDTDVVEFVTESGVGTFHPVVVHVAGQNSTEFSAIRAFFDYAPPTIVGTEPEELVFRTVGGDRIVLHGRDFGDGTAGNLSISDSFLGKTLYPPILHWNHSRIEFRMPAWQGAELSMTVTVADQTTSDISKTKDDGSNEVISVPFRVSYFPPVLTDFSPKSGPTSAKINGSDIVVTVKGDNFGVERDVFLGGKRVQLISSSHQELRFILTPGQGTREVRMFAGGQALERSGDTTFRHDPPEMVDVFANNPLYANQLIGRTDACPVLEPVTAFKHRRNIGDDQPPRLCCKPETYTVRGNNFGVDSVPQITYWDEEDRKVIVDQLCEDVDAVVEQKVFKTGVSLDCVVRTGCIMKYDHDRIVFRGQPGEGRDIPLRVRINDLFNGRPRVPDPEFVNTTSAVFSYAPPTITSVAPSEYDSSGDELVIEGINFGEADGSFCAPGGHPDVAVVFDNMFVCEKACRKVDDVHLNHNGMPFITCSSQNQIAGYHNITISVASQNRTHYFFETLAKSACYKPFYGNDGTEDGTPNPTDNRPFAEFCLECPEGGNCSYKRGFFGQEPISQPQFWREDITPETEEDYATLCPPERQHRPACPFFAACIPVEACTGNNTCEEGYTDVRCSECVKGRYYRSGGECVPCPDRMWLIILTFCLSIVVLANVAFIMTRYKMNMAIVSIGVDYIQVLAIFVKSKVQWPQYLKDFMQIFMVLNLDIDIGECVVPEFDYEVKWYMIESLMPLVASIFLVIFVLKLVWKKLCLRRDKRLFSHLPMLVSAGFTMLYFLYLPATRYTLEVFNCVPSDPPDPRGRLYMEATAKECFKKGGMHLRLFPWAVVVMAVYIVGYPVFVGQLLYRKREACKEDQILRAMRVGESRRTNPNLYHFRKMYHRLYFMFKPKLYFWTIIIISRKFFLAMTYLIFRQNPLFQLCMSLLVVFFSFVVQMRWRPYLCDPEFKEVLEHHQKMCAMGSRLHGKLDNSIREVRRMMTQAVTQQKASKYTFKNMKASTDVVDDHEDVQRKRNKRLDKFRKNPLQELPSAPPRSPKVEVLTNYNTVDAMLLASAVLVNLAGIMFESGKFSDKNVDQTRDTITMLVLIIIILSISYYLWVLVSEIMSVIFPNRFMRICGPTPEHKRKAKQIRKGTVVSKNPVPESSASKKTPKAAEGNNDPFQTKVGSDGAAFFSNPMLHQKAAADESRELEPEEFEPSKLPEGVPPNSIYRQYVTEFRRMEQSLDEHLKQQRQKQRLKGLLGSADVNDPTVPQFVRRDAHKPVGQRGAASSNIASLQAGGYQLPGAVTIKKG